MELGGLGKSLSRGKVRALTQCAVAGMRNSGVIWFKFRLATKSKKLANWEFEIG